MIDYITAWRELMIEPYQWVLFEHGTCVILTKTSTIPAAHAALALRRLYENGKDGYGDYGVKELTHNKGWIISSTNPDVFNLLTYGEVPAEYRKDSLTIGTHALKKRKLDATRLKVIHIEEPR